MSKKYREFNAINYSSLVKLSISPYFYKVSKDSGPSDTSEAMIIGDAVDCRLTSNNQFWDRFIVETIDRPSGLIGEFISIYERLSKDKHGEVIIFDDELVEKAYNYTGFKRDSLEKIKTQIQEPNIVEIFNFINDSNGKTILNAKQFELICKLTNKVFVSPFAKYFVNSDSIRNVYQHEIYWDKKTKKSLLDIVHINKDTKEFEIIDLKTTINYPSTFKKSVDKYRYDIQEAFYTDAFKSCKLYEELIDKEYTFKGFKFLLINTVTDSPVFLCELSEDLYNRGLNGGYDNGVYYKGYKELLDDLKWHTENDSWDYPKDVYLNNMCYKIN